MASKHFDIEITVRKVHPGEWVWRNNVLFPRENEGYNICCSVGNGDILTSGTKAEMIEFLRRWGFEYVPRKRRYQR